MAIVIESTPKSISPVGNPLVFTFSEDTTYLTADEFYFSVEIYVAGTLVSTRETVIESIWNDGVSDLAFGKIDVSETVELYISNNIRTESIAMVGTGTSVQIKVTGVADGTGGTQIGSSITRAFGGSLTKTDWIDYQNDVLFPNTSSATLPVEWLTQFPTGENYYVALDEQCFLYSYASGEFFGNLDIELFDINGSSIVSTRHNFTSTAETIQCNVSPATIVANTPITDANFSTCAYYTITGLDDSGTPATITDTFTFHIDLDCTRYEKTRVYFLSKTGNVESYTFKMLSDETIRTTASGYSETWGEFIQDGTTSNDYVHDLESGGSKQYLMQSKRMLKLESDWMSESLQNWFVRNCYESPNVVVERDGKYQSCIIKTVNSKIKKKVNQKLIRETLMIEMSHGDKSQIL